MNFIEDILALIKGKDPVQLLVNDMVKDCCDDNKPLEVGLYDKEDKPLVGELVYVTVYSKTYTIKTDKEGVARLPINLNPKEYELKVEYKGNEKYNGSKTYVNIIVNPIITTKDLNMVYKDGSSFEAQISDVKGKGIEGIPVTMTLITSSGGTKDYDFITDADGKAKLPINLLAGTYNIKTTCIKQSKNNKVVVKDNQTSNVKVTQNDGVYTSTPHYISIGCNRLGQCTSYYCGVHSLKQVLAKFNDIDVSEKTLAGWAGTTTSGTSHDGINTALKKFNSKYSTNYSIEWINFSSLGNNTDERFKRLGELISSSNCDAIVHNLYRNKYGHYEVIKDINTKNKSVNVLNSLGTKTGSSYKGYIEVRSYSTFQQYISGISQKSVALIRKQ